jgi:UDP-glucose 4-epimerase
MNALLLGGNGFIGAHLALHLLAQGHRVRILDRGKPRSQLRNLPLEYIESDWTDADAIAKALDGTDVVYHLVSATVPSTAAADPIRDIEANLVGSVRLFERMIGLGYRRIVFLSSGGTVYGNPTELPVPETASCNPISSYGIVKLAIERYLGQYRRQGLLDPLVVRAANPYGPLQSATRGQGVVATFLNFAMDGRPLPLWGDGSQVRDYLHVADLVRLLVIGASEGAVGTYNAGSGTGLTVLQLRDAIASVLGKEVETVRQGEQPYGVEALVLDIAKARRELGWTPRIGLAEGLESTVAWMKSHAGS